MDKVLNITETLHHFTDIVTFDLYFSSLLHLFVRQSKTIRLCEMKVYTLADAGQ